MNLKDIIKAEIERIMRDKLSETIEVEFCVGSDKIVAKTAISCSLNGIEYSTSSSNEAIKDIVKELNVNYEEPINFIFYKSNGSIYLMVDEITYFGYKDGRLKVEESLYYYDPLFPATKSVENNELRDGDWVMIRNDISGFGIVFKDRIHTLQQTYFTSIPIENKNYTKLIF